MDTLYVLQLDARENGQNLDALSQINKCYFGWLKTKIDDFDPRFLDENQGSVEVWVVTAGRGKSRGRVAWQKLKDGNVFAIKIELEQEIAPGTNFVTEYTFVQQDKLNATIRISLSRRAVSDIVSPVHWARPHAPSFVRKILALPEIIWSVHGQTISRSYQKIQTEQAFIELSSRFSGERKLPLLLVDTIQKTRLDFAKEAQSDFIGLAEVVCLPSVEYKRALAISHPRFQVPYAGARLVWPDSEARALDFEDKDIDEGRALGVLRKFLFTTSALTRGENRIWNTTCSEFLERQRIVEFEERLHAAKSNSDESEMLSLFEQENKRLGEEIKILKHANEALEGLVSDLKAERSVAEENFRAILAYTPSAVSEVEIDLGLLASEDSSEFNDLFNKLELATMGAIVFTPNALLAWNTGGRPEPAKMRRALVGLAKAAKVWKDEDRKIGEGLSFWLSEQLGLSVPFTDEGLRRNGLNLFGFDGVENRDRTPHVKVKDATSPQHVARIYFQVDEANSRFVVDHVGLKLYGVNN